MNRLRLLSLLTVGSLALPALSPAVAFAQAAAPSTEVKSVRGTVEKLDGNTLTVRTKTGTATVNLAPTWGVRAVVPSSLADIKPGTFIGTATVGTENNMTSQEVVVFPDAMKGTGEGSYPWDLTPESTMTNATVSSQVKEASGQKLTLTYKGGTKTVTVPAGVPIVTFKPGEKSMVVPGVHVFARGPAQPDGSIAAGGVAVGENGLIPPM